MQLVVYIACGSAVGRGHRSPLSHWRSTQLEFPPKTELDKRLEGPRRGGIRDHQHRRSQIATGGAKDKNLFVRAMAARALGILGQDSATHSRNGQLTRRRWFVSAPSIPGLLKMKAEVIELAKKDVNNAVAGRKSVPKCQRRNRLCRLSESLRRRIKREVMAPPRSPAGTRLLCPHQRGKVHSS